MGKNIELEQLVINKLTQEQYDALAVKNPGELYFITDANPTKEVETQLAELSEKVPEPISTYESFPEATAENVGMRVVYTGETIEAPYIENEDGSVSTVFLDPYLTRGHTFMLVPVQVLTSDTESITIYMWQDVIGAIPPFDYDMAGQVLSTNGMGYEWTELPEAGLTKEEADQTYLPLSGGTMSGDILMKTRNAFENYNINFLIPPFSAKTDYWLRLGYDATGAHHGLGIWAHYGNSDMCRYIFTTTGLLVSGNGKSDLGKAGYAWRNVYTTKLNNGADIAIPTEGGTLARLEDIPESTQVETIPEVSVDNVGKVLQYIGQTNETYTNGYFYKCLIDASNAFQLNTDNMWLPEHTISIVNANQLRKAIPNEYLAKENSILFYYDIFDGVSAWSCDLGNDGFFGPLTDDEMLNNYGISIVKTGDTDAQPGDYFSITYIAENEINGWQQINVQPEVDALPDQTDNAGKFLQTNGTEISWGNALVNQAKYPSYQIAIGGTTTSGTTGNIVIGHGSSSSEAFSIAIGDNCKVSAKGSILLNARGISKPYISQYAEVTEEDSFYVGLGGTSKGGLYKLLGADGTIPTDRYTITPTTAGTYVPKLTVAEDGTATREWGAESGGAGGDYLPLSGGTMTGALGFGEAEYALPDYGIIRQGSNMVLVFDGSPAYIRATSSSIYSWIDDHLSIGYIDYKLKNVYTHKLNNGADIEVPTSGGTMVVATPPTDNGTYVLKATVVDGVVTTEWVLEA